MPDTGSRDTAVRSHIPMDFPRTNNGDSDPLFRRN